MPPRQQLSIILSTTKRGRLTPQPTLAAWLPEVSYPSVPIPWQRPISNWLCLTLDQYARLSASNWLGPTPNDHQKTPQYSQHSCGCSRSGHLPLLGAQDGALTMLSNWYALPACLWVSSSIPYWVALLEYLLRTCPAPNVVDCS